MSTNDTPTAAPADWIEAAAAPFEKAADEIGLANYWRHTPDGYAVLQLTLEGVEGPNVPDHLNRAVVVRVFARSEDPVDGLRIVGLTSVHAQVWETTVSSETPILVVWGIAREVARQLRDELYR